MSLVVDTCVIIDVLDGRSPFSKASAKTLDKYADKGLLIAPISYVELAPAFLGDENRERDFLLDLGIDLPPLIDNTDLSAAHAAWYRQVLRKRQGKTARRPIADVMIGALASVNEGLITRNVKDFRALFPKLRIISP